MIQQGLLAKDFLIFLFLISLYRHFPGPFSALKNNLRLVAQGGICPPFYLLYLATDGRCLFAASVFLPWLLSALLFLRVTALVALLTAVDCVAPRIMRSAPSSGPAGCV